MFSYKTNQKYARSHNVILYRMARDRTNFNLKKYNNKIVLMQIYTNTYNHNSIPHNKFKANSLPIPKEMFL